MIALAGLAVSVTALNFAWRAQRQADTDIAATASRLAVAVGKTETEARRQLLGQTDRTIDVQFAFHPSTAHDAAGAASKGTLKGIVGYYRKLQPQRMVITGPAGSGKTVLAVELILGLLEQRAADTPVPVRISAASLDTSRPVESAIEDWLTWHLRQTYGLSVTAAQQLVAARMVIPVLDGLDEMDAVETPGYSSRAGRAIRACNAYVDADQKGAIVLTSRISQYEALEQAREWVHDAARIQLHPVGVAAARSFLTRRVSDAGRWRTVLEQMRRVGNQPLARALATPWRLTLAATVYEQRDPENGSYIRDPSDLTDPAFDTDDKIRDHLLGLYIPAVMAAHPGRYSNSTVHRWLGVLSAYLDGNTATVDRPAPVVAGRTLSGSDLVLHELWPLGGSRAPRAVSASIVAAIFFGLAGLAVTNVPIQFTLRAISGATAACLLGVSAIWFASGGWPEARIIDFRHMKTSRVLWSLAVGVAGALVVALIIGLMLKGAAVTFGFADRLAMGLGIAMAAVLGLELGDDPDQYSIADPRTALRNTVQVGLVVGLITGVAAGLTLRAAVGPLFGLAVGIGAGLYFGPLGFARWGFPCLRFIALLLCTRRWNDRWLPWRLGRFLDWCYQAGLIRVAGNSYQLRHRELQDYLAQHPVPRPPGLESEHDAILARIHR